MSRNTQKTARVVATGDLVSATTTVRVFGISWLGGAGLGTIELKDGGSGGVSKVIIDTGNGTNGTMDFGKGILFTTDVHATLGGTVAPAGVTILYEG